MIPGRVVGTADAAIVEISAFKLIGCLRSAGSVKLDDIGGAERVRVDAVVIVRPAVTHGNIHHYRNKVSGRNATFPIGHTVIDVGLGKQTKIR